MKRFEIILHGTGKDQWKMLEEPTRRRSHSLGGRATNSTSNDEQADDNSLEPVTGKLITMLRVVVTL